MSATVFAYRGWILAGCGVLVALMVWVLRRWDADERVTARREEILRAARYRPDDGMTDVFAVGTYACETCGLTFSLNATFPGVTVSGRCRCQTKFEVAPAERAS